MASVTTEITKQCIAILECAHGNESIGTYWLECAMFDGSTTLQQIMEWKESILKSRNLSSSGRLMITYNSIPD